jgi:hypothetical protein
LRLVAADGIDAGVHGPVSRVGVALLGSQAHRRTNARVGKDQQGGHPHGQDGEEDQREDQGTAPLVIPCFAQVKPKRDHPVALPTPETTNR